MGVEDSEMISFKDNIHYQLHASMISSGILVKGEVSTTYKGLCGRCLKKFKGELVNSDIYLFYEELVGSEMDITDDVRAALVVEIPINCVCKDDCSGLCHICGNNLNASKCDCQEPENEDSPWSKLNNLEL